MFQRSTRLLLTGLLAAITVVGCGQTPATSVRRAPIASAPLQAEEPDALPVGADPDEPSVRVIPGGYVPDQLIVAMKPGYRAVLATGEMRTLRQWDMGARFQVLEIPRGMTREQAIAKLQRQAGVQLVAPNHIYSTTDVPNDSRFSEQWAMKGDRIDAEAGFAVDARNVTVAVLDTGVDYNHPELKGRVILGPNLADGTSDPMDNEGHGTHVAGIIGAAANNGEGIAGVAPNCKILAVKVLGANGSGNTDTVAEGIMYAANHGARVINLSLGGSQKQVSVDPVLNMAIQYAYNKGVITIAAAGNDSGHVVSPANDPLALAVSSTSSFWKFEWMSLFSNRGDRVFVSAPGGGILSLLPSAGTRRGKMYGKMSGTSMAAPFVAGEAALIAAQHPDWTPARIKARIQAAVDDKGAANRDPKYGFGRINIRKALD